MGMQVGGTEEVYEAEENEMMVEMSKSQRTE